MGIYTGLQYGDTNAATLAGLREDIYYLGKVNSGFIGTGDLNRIINKYYARAQEVIRQINENFYMVIAVADLQLASVNNSSYSYPDGSGTVTPAPPYEKLKAVFVALNPVDKTNPQPNEFQRCNVADPDSISNPAYGFTIPTVLPFGTFFTLRPDLVDTTLYPVTKGMKIYYIADINKLVNDVDVPLIFPSFHDVIVHGSLMDIAKRKKDKQMLTDAKEAWETRIEEMRSYASNRLPQEVGIVEGQDNQGGWAYPWGKNNQWGL